MWGELARAVRPVHADTGDCAARLVWIDAESDRRRDQLDDRIFHVQSYGDTNAGSSINRCRNCR